MEWDISAECISAIIILIIMVYSRKSDLVPTLKNRIFQCCLYVTFFSCSMNILSTRLLQYIDIVPVWLNSVILWFYFLFTPLMGTFYFLYTMSVVDLKPKMFRFYTILGLIPAVLYILLLCTNPWTNALYILTQTSYDRGPWIITTYLVFYIYVLYCLIIVITRRKDLEPVVCRILGVFPFLSAIIILLQQYVFPQLILTGSAAMCSLLIIYLYLQNRQIFTDTLTQQLNRQEFTKMVGMNIHAQHPFSILVLSLKEFKFINDKFGQQIGDQLLLAVCDFLRTLGARDRLFRYSGDEFALILQDQNQLDSCIEAIQKRMESPWRIANFDYSLQYVLASISYPQVASNEDECSKGLEYALLLSKQGEHSYYACTREFMDRIQRRLEIVEILKTALDEESFQLYYQPIYDRGMKGFYKAEALLRLPENPLGFVSPDEFIPIAEETGLINEITYQVLDKACSFLARLRKDHISIDGISVNFSIVQFMQDNLEEQVLKIIEKHGVPCNLVCIEITESTLSTNLDTVVSFIKSMSEKGIRFLLDDFGTGYSNISYVLSIPFHTIKIDKSLLWSAMEDEHSKIMLDHIIRAFKKLGLRVLCEGVEDLDQITMLEEMGCDLYQGFYFYKPMPEEEAYGVFAKEKMIEENEAEES